MRSALWLAVLMLGSVRAQVTLTTDLVGYWNFDEGSGTTIYDLSGNGNNGTLVNGASAWTTGHFGSALYFPGVTGTGSTRVEIPNSASLQITSAITVAAWVRVDNFTSDAPILAKEGPNSGDLSYWLGTYGPSGAGHFGMLLDNNGSQPWDADHRNEGSVPTGWVHLAATWDGTTMINYINGTAVSSGLTFASTINVSPEFLAIGVNSGYYNHGNATAFTGAIDDLYLYSRALSASEIGQLMVSPIPEPATTTAMMGVLACAGAGWIWRRRARAV